MQDSLKKLKKKNSKLKEEHKTAAGAASAPSQSARLKPAAPSLIEVSAEESKSNTFAPAESTEGKGAEPALGDMVSSDEGETPSATSGNTREGNHRPASVEFGLLERLNRPFHI